MTNNSLYHHGVKGMKWGVRRYQNKDGSLTDAGKKRAEKTSDPDRTKKIMKRVLAGAMMTATVAGAAYYVSKHPEMVKNISSKMSGVKIKDLSSQAISKGKTFVKASAKAVKNGVKEGVKEGLKDAPKKAAKAVVTGVTLNAVKRMLDNTVGKEESARIFQANDAKKIGKFWKVSDNDKDD